MQHFRAFSNSVASAAKDMASAAKDLTANTKARGNSGRQYNIGDKTVIEERIISEGGFAFVWIVRDISSHQEMAMKRILCQVT